MSTHEIPLFKCKTSAQSENLQRKTNAKMPHQNSHRLFHCSQEKLWFKITIEAGAWKCNDSDTKKKLI